MKTVLAVLTVATAGAFYAWSVHQSKRIRAIYRNW